MQVKLLVDGGSMKPGPTLGQKLGPLGLNITEVIKKVNDATKNFSGLKVPIELDINLSTKNVEVSVFSPPVSELLKKELGIEKGSGIQHKVKVANASIEQIISIAKTKLPNMLCRNLKSAVKTVVGTCATLGILIENRSADEILKIINKGRFDKEIEEEKTQTPPEKKVKLNEYFSEIQAEQERIIKEEEAEAAKAEEEAEGEEKPKEGAVEAEEEKETKQEKPKEAKKKK